MVYICRLVSLLLILWVLAFLQFLLKLLQYYSPVSLCIEEHRAVRTVPELLKD